MFSAPSYAEWTKTSKNVGGDTYYVDFDRIRKHGGYVYFWELTDYLKPLKQVYFSSKSFHETDCKLLRYRPLSNDFYKEPMGGGTSRSLGESKNWRYASPGSVVEVVLKQVCNQ